MEFTTPVSLENEVEIPRRQETPQNTSNGETAGPDVISNGHAKRKRDAEEPLEIGEGQHPAKKFAKTPGAMETSQGNPIVLEEDTGAILIDDD